jgi:hypothetical protein
MKVARWCSPVSSTGEHRWPARAWVRRWRPQDMKRTREPLRTVQVHCETNVRTGGLSRSAGRPGRTGARSSFGEHHHLLTLRRPPPSMSATVVEAHHRG